MLGPVDALLPGDADQGARGALAIGFSWVAAVGLGVLAAILPARRAARLNVIEALTYE